MRKILFALALCAISTSGMAQWRFGVKVGVDNNGISNPLKDAFDTHHRWGVLGGAMAQWQMSRDLCLQGELLYAQRGFKTEVYVGMDEDSQAKDWNFSFHYIDLPVTVRYRPFDSIVYLEAGPQVGYLVDSGDKIKDYDYDGQTLESHTNKVDFGLVGGIGADVTEHFSVGARYYHGLTKSWKNFDGGKNRSLELSVGYWF